MQEHVRHATTLPDGYYAVMHPSGVRLFWLKTTTTNKVFYGRRAWFYRVERNGHLHFQRFALLNEDMTTRIYYKYLEGPDAWTPDQIVGVTEDIAEIIRNPYESSTLARTIMRNESREHEALARKKKEQQGGSGAPESTAQKEQE